MPLGVKPAKMAVMATNTSFALGHRFFHPRAAAGSRSGNSRRRAAGCYAARCQAEVGRRSRQVPHFVRTDDRTAATTLTDLASLKPYRKEATLFSSVGCEAATISFCQ